MAFSPETYVLLNGKIKKLQGEVDKLESATKWLGVTTTPITDGSSVNPITINGQSVTAESGNIVSYDNSEFIFNGNVWQEFGGGTSGTLEYELISGRGGMTVPVTFNYNGETYYKVATQQGVLPSDFPEYSESYGKTFRLDMIHSPITVPPVIDHYDAIYNEYEVESDVYYMMCSGTGDLSDIRENPLYLIMWQFDPNVEDTIYSIWGKSANTQINSWELYEIKENADLIVDREPTEDSTNLVTSGGVYNSLKDSGKIIKYEKLSGSGGTRVTKFPLVYSNVEYYFVRPTERILYDEFDPKNLSCDESSVFEFVLPEGTYDAYYIHYGFWDEDDYYFMCIGHGSREDVINNPTYILGISTSFYMLDGTTHIGLYAQSDKDQIEGPWHLYEIINTGAALSSMALGSFLKGMVTMGHNDDSSTSASSSTIEYNEKPYYKVYDAFTPAMFDINGSYIISSDSDIGEFYGYLIPGDVSPSQPFQTYYICFGPSDMSRDEIIDTPAVLCELRGKPNGDKIIPRFIMYIPDPDTEFAPWWLYMKTDVKELPVGDYPSMGGIDLVPSGGIYQFVMDNLPEEEPPIEFYRERLYGTGGEVIESQTISWDSNTYYKVVPYTSYLGNGVLSESEFPIFDNVSTYKFQYTISGGELVTLNAYYELDEEHRNLLLCGSGDRDEVTSNPTYIIYIFTDSMDSPKTFTFYNLYSNSSSGRIWDWRITELSKEESVTLDTKPKENSRTFVESGGVYSAVDAIDKRGTVTVDSKMVTRTAPYLHLGYRAEASVPDGAEGQPIKKLHIHRHLSQDCNGYDRPWGPGGGKNLIAGTTNVEVKVSSGSSKTYEFDLAPGFWSFGIDVEFSLSGTTAGELTITAAQLDPAGPSSVIESITFDSSFPAYEVTRVNVPGFEILVASHVVVTLSNSSTGLRRMSLNYPMLEKGQIAHGYEPYANPSEINVQTVNPSLYQDGSEGEVRYYYFGIAESNPLIWPPAEFEMETDAYGNGYLLVLSIKKRLNPWGPFYKVDGENVFYTDGLASQMIIPEGEYGLDAKCTIYEASHDQNNNDTFFICGDADDHPGRIYFYPAKEYTSAEDFSSDLSSYNVEIAYRTKNRTRYTLTMTSMDLYPSPSYTAQYVGFTPIELVGGYNKFYLDDNKHGSLFDSEFTITYTPDLVKRINEIAQPRQGAIVVDYEQWVPSNNGTSNIYRQNVTVNGGIEITANSKIDLQLTPEQIEWLISVGVSGLVVENDDGILTIYSIGGAPDDRSATIQCTVTELDPRFEIYGG